MAAGSEIQNNGGIRANGGDSPIPRSYEPQHTILIVDDERGPRESLRMILSPHHRVLQSESGALALEILRSERVDLMTLDLNMPGMMGDDLMRTVRAEFPEVEIIVITGCGSLESAAEGIRHGICDYLQKPFDVVQVTAAVVRALSRHTARTRLSSFLRELGRVVGRDREATAILNDVQRSQKMRGQLGDLLQVCGSDPAQELAPSQTIEFLEVLAETIETKDRFMRGHARRVAFYAGLIADRLDISEDDRENIRIAAFLHDLGKVGVPTDLLLRAGALDKGERALVEQHPEIGARLIAPLNVAPSTSLAIRHHHEWWDGSGYPDGLAGDEIPLTARIISVADAFDAMSCDRPYRQALGRDVVVGELERFGGTQFDSEITKMFLEVLVAGVADVDLQLVADSVGQPPVSAVAAS
jgi:response regulator RpfG family c-di-GMP phosphodiesterase